MKEFKKCINCNIDFFIYTSKSIEGRGQYCSRACKADYAKKNSGSIRECSFCKKEFYAKGNPKAKIYCSIKCSAEGRKSGQIIACAYCGKETYKPKNQSARATNSFCSQGCANKYQQETKDKSKMKESGTNSILSQLKKKGFNKLELKGREILESLKLDFKEQVPMYNKFIVDVLIETKKIVIQWDGEYWHSKTANKQRDESQDKYLKKCGYTVLRYTDIQIKESLQSVIDDIKQKCC